MTESIKGLVRVLDQALELAQNRLNAKRCGQNDLASEEGLQVIIGALQSRKDEAINVGFEVSEIDISLGIARAALEYDSQQSALIRKIGDVERYFAQHFVKRSM